MAGGVRRPAVLRPGREHLGEVRLPAALAVAAAIALYAFLPDSLTPGPRLVIPALEIALFVAVLAVNPRRMTREDVRSRALGIALVLLIAAGNIWSLVALLDRLLAGGVHQGRPLLTSALQVWLTNILVFALLFWELDRGGPVARTQLPREELPAADFRFPQDEDHDAAAEVASRSSRKSGWKPQFVDYLYLSVTNSSAFSPTDTMPLSPRAKLLMSVQAIAALLLSVLVIARAVNILS